MKSKQAEPAPSAALVQLIHAHRGHLSGQQRAEGAQWLIAALGRREAGRGEAGRGEAKSRRGHWFRVGSPIAFAAVALLAATFAFERHKGLVLSYTVEGGHLASGGYVEADSLGQPRLRFSDGSEVVLAGGTRAFVRSVAGHGARVALAEGRAHVDVAHLPGAHWLIDAGPFLIAVTGTAFSVAWEPAAERLDVQMERGTVDVSGPLSDGAIPLRSGQHLIVRVRQRETLVRDVTDDSVSAPLAPPPSAAIETAPPNSAPSSPGGIANSKAPGRTTGRANEGETWSAQLAKGDFEGVVRRAEQRGLETCLAEASSEDLAALADAARYVRRGDVARRALEAERRRFPLSESARDACFLLGRLEEADQNTPLAIDWYSRYLTESPAGTYASEALGRKMELTARVYSDDRARALAAEYLLRFPHGMYAARARALRPAP